MAASTPPSLLSLPLLVVEGIAEALCPHCTEETELYPWKTPLHWFENQHRMLINTQSLANLAVTCRAMHAVITPFLYHQPQGYSPKRPGLFRTLAKYPELARRVKVLRLDYDAGIVELPNDKDDREFLLSLAAQYGWSTDVQDGVSPDDTRELLTTLLIAMCPNLETLSTGRDYFEQFRLLQPATLPRLKDVYVAHLDTDMGMDLGELMPLYLAAPNIETFSAAMASGVGKGDSALGNVTNLRLDSAGISTACLRTLLRSCPRLESFVYTAGGMTVNDRQFDGRSARRLLCRWAPGLKHLAMDLRDRDCMGDWDDVGDSSNKDNDSELLPGVASLLYLETLIIDATVVGEWDSRPVVALFPQSLRSLVVYRAYPTGIAEVSEAEWKEFRELAGSFLRNLKSIKIEGSIIN